MLGSMLSSFPSFAKAGSENCGMPIETTPPAIAWIKKTLRLDRHSSSVDPAKGDVKSAEVVTMGTLPLMLG